MSSSKENPEVLKSEYLSSISRSVGTKTIILTFPARDLHSRFSSRVLSLTTNKKVVGLTSCTVIIFSGRFSLWSPHSHWRSVTIYNLHVLLYVRIRILYEYIAIPRYFTRIIGPTMGDWRYMCSKFRRQCWRNLFSMLVICRCGLNVNCSKYISRR